MTFHVQQAGYQVDTAASAEDGLQNIHDEPVDLILLDIGLPGMDGLAALRHFNDKVGAPVIFLTARRRELDEILGLELGADDYITKPFDTSVLLARIKAVLRRTRQKQHLAAAPEAFSVGDIEINPRAHTVMLKGVLIELTPIEFKLLKVLAQQQGHVCSADDLLRKVWGSEYVGQPQVVYVHIRALRTKLEENPNKPQRIMTVRGVGYKLIEQKRQ
ncbi:MAG: response regulator transcription factor [Anaerolineales bacterium]|nr:response regulator transcription factor [Anaerolineales bacterium]